jgi:hypothetical protein
VEPDPQADSVRKFKYPFIACEILCSDVYTLVDAIYADHTYLESLYNFLQRPAPLNPALATHVSKVIRAVVSGRRVRSPSPLLKVAGALLEKKGPATLEFLRARTDLVDSFVAHLSSSAVMDLLLKVISCDQVEIMKSVIVWLTKRICSRTTDRCCSCCAPTIWLASSSARLERASHTLSFSHLLFSLSRATLPNCTSTRHRHSPTSFRFACVPKSEASHNIIARRTRSSFRTQLRCLWSTRPARSWHSWSRAPL